MPPKTTVQTMVTCSIRSGNKDVFYLSTAGELRRRQSTMGADMKVLRMVATIILVVVSFGCSGLGSAEQTPAKTGEKVPVGSDHLEQEDNAPKLQASPEGTVMELYADEIFFHIRNSFPPPMVQRFSRYFTPELISHFESHNADVDRWMEEHKNESLKLPMSEGPIFISNFEGANTFVVGQAKVDASHAEVPVTFSYTEGAESFGWIDIVILRLVDCVWLMDDIRFDPERWDNYTVRKRVALAE